MRNKTLLKALIAAASAILLLANSTHVSGQKVSNVEFFQSGKKVHVTYTLDKNADISLYISTNGGRDFKGPLREVSGDVGNNVRAGNNIIIWDALAEMDEVVSDQVVFKVTAYSWKEEKAMANSRKREERKRKGGGWLNYGFDLDWRFLGGTEYNLGIAVRLGNYLWPVQFEVGIKPGYVNGLLSDGNEDIKGFQMPVYAKLKVNLWTSLITDDAKIFLYGAGFYNGIGKRIGEEFDFSIGFGYGFRHVDWNILYYKYPAGMGMSLAFYF